MKDFLAKFKRKPQRVLGDGNCLFRALSAQLTGTEENHIALCKIIVEFEAKNPSIFGKKVQAAKRDFTAHLESMQKIFVWGTDIEIEAAASLFQTEIYEATDCPVRWLKFSPISKSLLSSLACADSINSGGSRGGPGRAWPTQTRPAKILKVLTIVQNYYRSEQSSHY